MSKTYALGQVIEISTDDIKLSVYKNFLMLQKNNVEISRIGLDSICSIVISNNNFVLTGQLSVALAENNIPLFFCNSKYLPISILSPLYYHHKHKEILHYQINASLPLIKQCWQSIVKQKIYNQAVVLQHYKCNNVEVLKDMSKQVLSGDSSFLESQAAKIYFTSLFGENFIRNENNDENIINILLNYGYTIVRSAMARAVLGAGLNSVLGVFHKNLYNAYCLVDDLMEPYRPLVDLLVKQIIISKNITELTPEVKKYLVSVLTIDLQYNNKNIPLVNCCNYLAQSYVNSLVNGSLQLQFGSLKV